MSRNSSREYSVANNSPVVVGTAPIATSSVRTGDASLKTITTERREAFPIAILVLAITCAALFAYMIYNYVLINEHTNVLADLRAEISTLSTDMNDLNAKLDRKNNLSMIEQMAREDYGMVSIDEIQKRYITMDFGDVIIKTDN